MFPIPTTSILMIVWLPGWLWKAADERWRHICIWAVKRRGMKWTRPSHLLGIMRYTSHAEHRELTDTTMDLEQCSTWECCRALPFLWCGLALGQGQFRLLLIVVLLGYLNGNKVCWPCDFGTITLEPTSIDASPVCRTLLVSFP